MSGHTCTTLTPGCFRCELHRDEIREYVASLGVTQSGVVHDPDCSFVKRPMSTATSWDCRFPHDRACSRCLPAGLPGEPAAGP